MSPPPFPDTPVVSRDIGVLHAGWSHADISDKIADRVLRQPPGRAWRLAFWALLLGMLLFMAAMGWLFVKGIGIWGVNIPVAWGFAIANCVWWIGIGHAGTFISAVLLLLRQRWRTSINRFAEAMTLFAALMAGLFPILHLGRPWFFYWIAPYPDKMNLWPQWRSPLVWDFFAIATYLIVSFLFWYIGLMPDLATLRDRARGRVQQIAYGLGALGWRGEARHWRRHQSAYWLLAGLATPLVVSVHSVVSLDFAIGNTPGYHSTIFPPFFVAGALFSGFAMVLTLAIPLRRAFALHDFITDVHLDHAAKVLLATGAVVAYGYLWEAFIAFYSGDEFEITMMINRWRGPYAGVYWAMLCCNVLAPQLLWWRAVRRHALALFVLSLVINAGMWMERVLIVVSSLNRDYMPSAWGLFVPTAWDWLFLLGSICTFVWLFLAFIRLLPAISMSEMRELARESAHEPGAAGDAKALDHEHDSELHGTHGRPASEAHAGPAKAPASRASPRRTEGLMAEFATADALLQAARRLQAEGWRGVHAYAPFHIDGLPEALGARPTRIPLITLLGGLVGGASGFLLQWYSAVIDYPLNIGGRPTNSWPMFVPVTFEMTVLGAALAAVGAMLVRNRLPRLRHPVFEAPDIKLASRNRFFLVLPPTPDAAREAEARRLLDELHPLRYAEVSPC